MALTRPLASVAAVTLVALGLLALLPDCASACTCAIFPGSQRERAERALAESTAVFAGEVLDIEKGDKIWGGVPSTKVSFRVSEVWKGPKRETLEVSTPRQGGACGYAFSEGQMYLVNATGRMVVDSCGETTPLSKASADLEALGDGEAVGDGALSDTSGGLPRLEIVGMMGLAVAAVSLVVLMRLLRTS